ncbi:MAG: transporter ATP-binding protein, partial [Devosia sp.]|nr:transporter ATP-binding protein [Devosia sp.]
AELRSFRWREVAMVFQSAMNSLNPVLTIEDQFYDVLNTHTGMSRSAARERAAELLGLVDIPTDRLSAYPHQLSGGMRQRIVIAICLALKPKLIIMDEPTTALDVVVQREILQRIHKLRQELGFSVLFITHDLALMVQVSDRIGIMLEGELVEVNDAQTIYRSPAHDYTRKLWASMPRLHGAQIAQDAK